VVSGNTKDVGEITFIDGTICACGGYTKILADTMTPETWPNRICRAGFLHRNSRHMGSTIMPKLCKTI